MEGSIEKMLPKKPLLYFFGAFFANFFCKLVLCGIFLGGLFVSANALISQEVWKGDLKEKDLGIAALHRLLQEGRSLPKSLRLRYSRKYLNYIVFYDLLGQEIFFRYREDRFDHRAERKIRGLIPGQAYEVFGDLEALSIEGSVTKKEAPTFLMHLKKPDAVLIFSFLSARPLRLEQILF